ncbi:hypothetical protein [Streptomyces lunaelactis]|uniref:hypothetical protein n=1 Tax=Streptomyces lunaelactis TaxID=1535768 RepID=UPI0015855515|nr:hypothetical protein [Streptomyces lunaelactis]NUL09081.1 hypothetical protein [Streptomyces lunaelactis]
MRTTLAITAALLLALTGCSSSADAEPAKTVTATTTAPPELSKAESRQQCVDAVADVATDSEGTSADGVPFEPTPAPCTQLSEHDYLDAYMDGIMQHNKANLDKFSRQASEAAEADQP